MASVLISQGNHLTDIALEEAACAPPLRAEGIEGGKREIGGWVDREEEATESEQWWRRAVGGRGGRRGG